MLTCKDTARLLAEDALGASRMERLGVRMHLLMCRFCRRYSAQLRAMGEACRDHVNATADDPVTLARLEQSILKRHRP